jgi:hypothetical protein
LSTLGDADNIPIGDLNMSRRNKPNSRYEPPVFKTEEEKIAHVNRPVFKSAKEFAEAFPEFNDNRRLAFEHGNWSYTFLPTEYEDYGCYPGGYIVAWVNRTLPDDEAIASMPISSRTYWERQRKQRNPDHLYCVRINDGDDMYLIKHFATEDLAKEALAELELLAPFDPSSLVELFGYEYN